MTRGITDPHPMFLYLPLTHWVTYSRCFLGLGFALCTMEEKGERPEDNRFPFCSSPL